MADGKAKVTKATRIAFHAAVEEHYDPLDPRETAQALAKLFREAAVLVINASNQNVEVKEVQLNQVTTTNVRYSRIVIYGTQIKPGWQKEKE